MNWLHHKKEVKVVGRLPTETEIKNICDDFNVTNIFEVDGSLVARWARNDNKKGDLLAVISWREERSSRPYRDTVSQIFVTRETVGKLEKHDLGAGGHIWHLPISA